MKSSDSPNSFALESQFQGAMHAGSERGETLMLQAQGWSRALAQETSRRRLVPSRG